VLQQGGVSIQIIDPTIGGAAAHVAVTLQHQTDQRSWNLIASRSVWYYYLSALIRCFTSPAVNSCE